MPQTTLTSETIAVHCFCGKHYAVPAKLEGRKIRCGRCKTQLHVGEPRKRRRAPRREATAREPHPRSIAPRSEPARKPATRRVDASGWAADPYAPPRATKPWAEPKSDSRLFRHRDLAAEGHVMAIGLWTRVWGLLGTLCVLGFALLTLPAVSGGAAAGVGALTILMLSFCVFGMFLGTHLMRIKNWARVVTGVLLGLQGLNVLYGLAVNPAAAALGGLISAGWISAQLWALFGHRGTQLFTPDYQARREADGRRVEWWLSPFFYVPAALFCLGILLVVGMLVVRV